MSYHQHRIYNSHNININLDTPSAVESARLLNDIKKQAEQSIVDRIDVVDNRFNCAMHLYNDMQTLSQYIQVTYSLNDVKNTFAMSMLPWTSFEENVISIRDALAKQLAAEILQSGFTKELMDVMYRSANPPRPPQAPNPISLHK